MFLSKETQHAIQAMLYIAAYGKDGSTVQSSEISEKLHLPHQFMLTGLMSLTKAGILRSQHGRGGGFGLARPANQITLYDVAVATGEGLKFNDRCILGFPVCSPDMPCPFHHSLKKLIDEFLAGLKKTSLAKLVEDPEKIETVIKELKSESRF